MSYRVGLIMDVQDRWSPTLHAQSRMLNRLQRQVTTVTRMASRIGGSSPAPARAALGIAKEEGRLAVARVRTESQIASIKARGSAATITAAHREQQAQLRTQALAARTASTQRQSEARARAAEVGLHGTRMRNAQSLFHSRQVHQVRLNNLRSKGENDAKLAQHRLYQAQMRSYVLQQKINRESSPKLTRDQQYVQDRVRRMRDPIDHENRIGGGLLGMAVGGGIVKSVAGIGRDPALRHYQQEKASFEQMNLGPRQNAKAFAAAEQLRQTVRGMDMADTIDVVKDLVNVTGHLEEAINPQLMRKFAQFKVSNKVAYGMSDHQALKAVQSAELLIPNSKGMNEQQKVNAIVGKLELVNKVMAGTSGKVTSDEMLGFAKTAQSARMSLSDTGLMKLVPLMQEMGGQRTGESLMSVMQNLANGRATVASVKNMMDMGLINTKMQVRDDKTGKMKSVDGVEYTSIGTVKRMRPGALKGDTLLRQDPVAWIEKHLMPKTKGMKTAEIDRMVNSILSDRSAAGLVMTTISQSQRINKGFHNIKGSRSIEQTDQAQQSNYFRQEQNFAASLNTLRQKTGSVALGPLTTFVDKLGVGVDRLNNIVTRYPEHTKVALMATAIGGAALAAGSAVVAIRSVTGALKGLSALRDIAPVAKNLAARQAITTTASEVVGSVAGNVVGGAASGAGSRTVAKSAASTTAKGGMRAAMGGVARNVGAVLFGTMLADAIAKSPVAKAASSIVGFFSRAVAGAGGALARVGLLMGGTVTGQALATIGSSLVAGLGSLIGGGLLVAAAAAVGVGIGTLIYKGLESSGFAGKMESWLAANLPSWALGDAGAARDRAEGTATAASGSINSKYGLTGQGLIDYNQDMRERRAKGMPVISPQQYATMQRGQGPLRAGVAGSEVSERTRAQRVSMGLPAVAMADSEWQQLKQGGGPVRSNVIAEDLKALAQGKSPMSPYVQDPRALAERGANLNATINLKVDAVKVPAAQARATADKAGRVTADALFDYMTTGSNPTSLPQKLR